MTNKRISIAEDFLRRHRATMNIKFRGKVFSPWGDNLWYSAYDVTIKRNGKSFTTDYNVSMYDIMNGVKPNPYDILMYLQRLNVETYEKFCECFGCDNSEYNLIRYYACKEEYENLIRIFYDCIEELQNIG